MQKSSMERFRDLLDREVFYGNFFWTMVAPWRLTNVKERIRRFWTLQK